MKKPESKDQFMDDFRNFSCKYCSNQKPKLYEIITISEKTIGFSLIVKFSYKKFSTIALYLCDECNNVSRCNVG